MTKEDKKHFEKAMYQLDGAFEKAKEKELKLETPAKRTDQQTQIKPKPIELKPTEPKPTELKPAELKPAELKPIKPEPAEPKPIKLEPAEPKPAEPKPIKLEPAEPKPIKLEPAEPKPVSPNTIKLSEKQPNLEIKKIPHQVTPNPISHKETHKKEKAPFDNSFDEAVEKLAKKKQQTCSNAQVTGLQKTEPQREVEVVPRGDIASNSIGDKKVWQETLENSLYLALNKILQKPSPFAEVDHLETTLPEEFYQDSEMVLKNRTGLKEKLSQFSDIKLDFYVQLGEMDITLGDLLDFKEGSILETEIASSTPLNCYANKKLLGRGKLVFEGYTAGFKLQNFFNQ